MRFTIYKASEQEMVKGCLMGDRTAQKRLYDAFSPKMYALCTRYLKDPMQAEDALVTAFTHVLEKINQFKGEGSLEAWIKSIVIREALTTLRRNNQIKFEIDLDEINFNTPYQPCDDSLETEDLLNMIHELPPGYQTVFNLYAIEGYSHKEIAQHLRISENTSKSQLSRARIYLQRLLSKHDKIQIINRNDITSR